MKDFERDRAFRLWQEKYSRRRLTRSQRMDFDARFGIYSGELKQRINLASRSSQGSQPPRGQ